MRVHRALRPKGSQLAKTVMSVLHEVTPEKNPVTAKREQSNLEPPSGEAPSMRTRSSRETALE